MSSWSTTFGKCAMTPNVIIPHRRRCLETSKRKVESIPGRILRWQVSMETPDGTIAADAKNISLSGAFICCAKPLPLGEVFLLTVTGPDNEPFTATAKVVWSNVNVPEEKVVNRGMGVRFIKMSDRHLRWVRHMLQESD